MTTTRRPRVHALLWLALPVGAMLFAARTPIEGAAADQVVTPTRTETPPRCEGIARRATDDELDCGEIATEVADLKKALAARAGPSVDLLKTMHARSACRWGAPDPAIDAYLRAIGVLVGVNEDARRAGERRSAEIGALQKTADAVCAVETGIAIAALRHPSPNGPCAKAMAAVEAAIKASIEAERAEDPGIERSADRVADTALKLQQSFRVRLAALEALSSAKRCAR